MSRAAVRAVVVDVGETLVDALDELPAVLRRPGGSGAVPDRNRRTVATGREG